MIKNSDITVVIPTIPPRLESLMYRRALDSAINQHFGCPLVATVVDLAHEGAARTRQRGLDKVTTEWVAFLDDDDVFMPDHLSLLAETAEDESADYVYSWFMIRDRDGVEHPEWDPFPGNFDRPFDPAHPVQTTITTLVRTELAKAVGFDTVPDGETGADGHRRGEDFRFTIGCIEQGARIVHRPQRTWFWTHHGVGAPGVPGNTSGMPDRW